MTANRCRPASFAEMAARTRADGRPAPRPPPSRSGPVDPSRRRRWRSPGGGGRPGPHPMSGPGLVGPRVSVRDRHVGVADLDPGVVVVAVPVPGPAVVVVPVVVAVVVPVMDPA